jgi:hypothetical protein
VRVFKNPSISDSFSHTRRAPEQVRGEREKDLPHPDPSPLRSEGRKKEAFRDNLPSFEKCSPVNHYVERGKNKGKGYKYALCIQILKL